MPRLTFTYDEPAETAAARLPSGAGVRPGQRSQQRFGLQGHRRASSPAQPGRLQRLCHLLPQRHDDVARRPPGRRRPARTIRASASSSANCSWSCSPTRRRSAPTGRRSPLDPSAPQGTSANQTAMAVWYSARSISLLSRLDAETAHGLAIRALKTGLVPGDRRPDAAVAGGHGVGPHAAQSDRPRRRLRQECRGARRHARPGLRVGRDRQRHAASRRRAIRARACSGCREDRGVINRMGFQRRRAWTPPAPAWPPAPAAASSASISAPTRTAPTAPPTTSPAAWRWRPMPTISSATSPRPTRRACATCRAAPQLADLLKRVQDAIAAKPVPLLVKIAPDATDDDLDDIVAVCRDLRMDGIIIGNTTLSRPASLRSDAARPRPAACRAPR